MTGATLWRTRPADAESSEYEGEYRGTLIRLTRLTDPNVWPGRNPMHEKDATTTRWDGYVADGLERDLTPRWALVAECRGTRSEALADLERYIDRKIGGPR